MKRKKGLLLVLFFAISVVPWLCVGVLVHVTTPDPDLPVVTSQQVNLNPLVSLQLPSNVQHITDTVDVSVFDSQAPAKCNVSYAVYADGRHLESAFSWVECIDIWTILGLGKRGTTYIETHIFAYDDVPSAEEGLEDYCRIKGPYKDRSDFVRSSISDGAYCISHVRRDTSLHPQARFDSMVLIQKRNVLIRIEERTSNEHNTHKNDVIDLLASAFAR